MLGLWRKFLAVAIKLRGFQVGLILAWNIYLMQQLPYFML